MGCLRTHFELIQKLIVGICLLCAVPAFAEKKNHSSTPNETSSTSAAGDSANSAGVQEILALLEKSPIQTDEITQKLSSLNEEDLRKLQELLREKLQEENAKETEDLGQLVGLIDKALEESTPEKTPSPSPSNTSEPKKAETTEQKSYKPKNLSERPEFKREFGSEGPPKSPEAWKEFLNRPAEKHSTKAAGLALEAMTSSGAQPINLDGEHFALPGGTPGTFSVLTKGELEKKSDDYRSAQSKLGGFTFENGPSGAFLKFSNSVIDFSKLTPAELEASGFKSILEKDLPVQISDDKWLVPQGDGIIVPKGTFRVVDAEEYKDEVSLARGRVKYDRGFEIGADGSYKFKDAKSQAEALDELLKPSSPLRRDLEIIQKDFANKVMLETMRAVAVTELMGMKTIPETAKLPPSRPKPDSTGNISPEQKSIYEAQLEIYDASQKVTKAQADLEKLERTRSLSANIQTKTRTDPQEFDRKIERAEEAARTASIDWAKKSFDLANRGVVPESAPSTLAKPLSLFSKLNGVAKRSSGDKASELSALNIRATFEDQLAQSVRLSKKGSFVLASDSPDGKRVGEFLLAASQSKRKLDESTYTEGKSPVFRDPKTLNDLDWQKLHEQQEQLFKDAVAYLGESHADYFTQGTVGIGNSMANFLWGRDKEVKARYQDALDKLKAVNDSVRKLSEADQRFMPLRYYIGEQSNALREALDKRQEESFDQIHNTVVKRAVSGAITAGSMGFVPALSAIAARLGLASASALPGLTVLGANGTRVALVTGKMVVPVADLSLKNAAAAALTGAVAGGASYSADIALRRTLDNDKSAKFTATGLATSLAQGAVLGGLSPRFPQTSELFGAYMSFNSAHSAAEAAQNGKWGAMASEGFSSFALPVAMNAAGKGVFKGDDNTPSSHKATVPEEGGAPSRLIQFLNDTYGSAKNMLSKDSNLGSTDSALVKNNTASVLPSENYVVSQVERKIKDLHSNPNLATGPPEERAKVLAREIVDARARERSSAGGEVVGDQYFTMGTEPLVKALQGKDLSGSTVLEFGGGTGVITSLIEKTGAKKIMTWEIDPPAIKALESIVDPNKTKIINSDFTEIDDWNKFITSNGTKVDEVHVISNPPYFLIPKIKKIIDQLGIQNVMLYIPKKRLGDFPKEEGWQTLGSLGASDFYPSAQTVVRNAEGVKTVSENNHLVIGKGIYAQAQRAMPSHTAASQEGGAPSRLIQFLNDTYGSAKAMLSNDSNLADKKGSSSPVEPIAKNNPNPRESVEDSPWLDRVKRSLSFFEKPDPKKSPLQAGAGVLAPASETPALNWDGLKLKSEAEAHSNWRDTNQAIREGDTIVGFKPRYKTTDVPNNPLGKGGSNLSEEILKDPIRLEQAVKAGHAIDIASVTDPRQLPAKIQKANRDSANEAYEAVKAGVENNADLDAVTSDWAKVESGKEPLSAFLEKHPFVKEGSTRVHNKWMENNSYLGSEHPQMKEFDSLDVIEQKKDVDFVVNAVKETQKSRKSLKKSSVNEPPPSEHDVLKVKAYDEALTAIQVRSNRLWDGLEDGQDLSHVVIGFGPASVNFVKALPADVETRGMIFELSKTGPSSNSFGPDLVAKDGDNKFYRADTNVVRDAQGNVILDLRGNLPHVDNYTPFLGNAESLTLGAVSGNGGTSADIAKTTAIVANQSQLPIALGVRMEVVGQVNGKWKVNATHVESGKTKTLFTDMVVEATGLGPENISATNPEAIAEIRAAKKSPDSIPTEEMRDAAKPFLNAVTVTGLRRRQKNLQAGGELPPGEIPILGSKEGVGYEGQKGRVIVFAGKGDSAAMAAQTIAHDHPDSIIIQAFGNDTNQGAFEGDLSHVIPDKTRPDVTAQDLVNSLKRATTVNGVSTDHPGMQVEKIYEKPDGTLEIHLRGLEKKTNPDGTVKYGRNFDPNGATKVIHADHFVNAIGFSNKGVFAKEAHSPSWGRVVGSDGTTIAASLESLNGEKVTNYYKIGSAAATVEMADGKPVVSKKELVGKQNSQPVSMELWMPRVRELGERLSPQLAELSANFPSKLIVPNTVTPAATDKSIPLSGLPIPKELPDGLKVLQGKGAPHYALQNSYLLSGVNQAITDQNTGLRLPPSSSSSKAIRSVHIDVTESNEGPKFSVRGLANEQDALKIRNALANQSTALVGSAAALKNGGGNISIHLAFGSDGALLPSMTGVETSTSFLANQYLAAAAKNNGSTAKIGLGAKSLVRSLVPRYAVEGGLPDTIASWVRSSLPGELGNIKVTHEMVRPESQIEIFKIETDQGTYFARVGNEGEHETQLKYLAGQQVFRQMGVETVSPSRVAILAEPNQSRVAASISGKGDGNGRIAVLVKADGEVKQTLRGKLKDLGDAQGKGTDSAAAEKEVATAVREVGAMMRKVHDGIPLSLDRNSHQKFMKRELEKVSSEIQDLEKSGVLSSSEAQELSRRVRVENETAAAEGQRHVGVTAGNFTPDGVLVGEGGKPILVGYSNLMRSLEVKRSGSTAVGDSRADLTRMLTNLEEARSLYGISEATFQKLKSELEVGYASDTKIEPNSFWRTRTQIENALSREKDRANRESIRRSLGLPD